MELWWQEKAYIDQIVDCAFYLQDSCPDAWLVSIGQSPAWIVLSASMLRKLQGAPANVAYIPFTGGFLQRDMNASSENTMRFNKRAGWSDESTVLADYFNYLYHLQLQPEQVKQQIESGQRFVFLEMIKKANGLASFLSAWLENADDTTRDFIVKNADFYVYDTEPNANSDALMTPNGIEVPLMRIGMTYEESEIMENTAPLNEVDENSSRLVPMYRLMAVGKYSPGLMLCPNQAVKKRIENVLHQKIQSRFQAGRQAQACCNHP